MISLSEEQLDMMKWFDRMFVCVSTLTPMESRAFEKWNRHRPDHLKTSDWPGFAKYLEVKPWLQFA